MLTPLVDIIYNKMYMHSFDKKLIINQGVHFHKKSLVILYITEV